MVHGVCRGGLEGRLLGLTLQAEHPELETQCSALLQQQEEQRLELAALDNHLLQSLATSKVCTAANYNTWRYQSLLISSFKPSLLCCNRG